jgi:quercetin dioxygenase-like cupin family protein
MDLEVFKAQLKEAGYDEVLEKTYAPNAFIDTHSHPFFARALVTAGQMVITCGEEARSYKAGEIFELEAHRMHTEHYGPVGATYLVGRKAA